MQIRQGATPGPIYITVNGIKSGPIRLVDFERPGSYSMIPTGPIQRDSTSAGTAQDYDFIANGRVGVKYAHGAADKCKAKWSTKVLVKFNGELFCYAAASGFVPGLFKHAKAAAWAKGQVGSGNAVDATASAASSESPSPLPLDLAAGPFGTTIALPVLKQGEERKPVAGFGDVDKSGEHSPNTELEITSTCIIQTGAVTQVDGGGSYAFANATLTAETVDPGSNPIIFSSSH